VIENEEELKHIAEDAATRAVEMTFLHLGVDLADADERAAMKERFEFLKRMDRGAREVKRAAIKTCVGAFITGSVALFLLGLQNWFHAAPKP
jgi:sugar phosphate isomerase/epimerase